MAGIFALIRHGYDVGAGNGGVWDFMGRHRTSLRKCMHRGFLHVTIGLHLDFNVRLVQILLFFSGNWCSAAALRRDLECRAQRYIIRRSADQMPKDASRLKDYYGHLNDA